MKNTNRGNEEKNLGGVGAESLNSQANGSQFTPGPWHVSDVFPMHFGECFLSHQVWGDFGPRICFIEQQNVGAEVAKANARLIAAAPALYEALKQMDTLMESLWDSVPWGQTFNLDVATLNEAPIAAKRALALVDSQVIPHLQRTKGIRI